MSFYQDHAMMRILAYSYLKSITKINLRLITNNSFLIKVFHYKFIIDNGYIMLFTTVSSSFYAPNNKYSLRNSIIVSQVFSKLLESNCIEELDQKPYCCNPLKVTESFYSF